MFVLHETLAHDTVELMRWPLCRVLFMNDANYPWLILVPQRTALTEIHHLTPVEQGTLMGDISRASRALEKAYAPDKINVAALGNMVSQLHIHVVARFMDDAAWPGPVWGKVPARPFEADALTNAVFKIKKELVKLDH